MSFTNINEPRKTVIGRYVGEASYTTGGEAVTAASFGLSRLDALILSNVGEGGFAFSYDPSASKIKAMWVDTTTDGAPLAEASSTTDVSGSPVDYIAIGLP